MKETCS